MKRIWVTVILFLGLLITIPLVLNITNYLQHASVDTFSNLAVTGSIFIDTNGNGILDNGEATYSGSPKPLVRLAIFPTTCSNQALTPIPTTQQTQPVISGSMAPIPPTPITCAPNQARICPAYSCIIRPNGTAVCPQCICMAVAPGVTVPVFPNRGNLVITAGSNPAVLTNPNIVTTISPNQATNNNSDVAALDICGGNAKQVIPCTVDNGTYSCIVSGKSFARAIILLNQPVGYNTTTADPYDIPADVLSQSAVTVNFGIALPTPTPTTATATPTPTVQPVCIPRPKCLGQKGCTFTTPPGGWCAAQSARYTEEQTRQMLDYLNTLLRQQFVH